jgi:hypothetical protein
VTNVVSEGLIFGADWNITETKADGTTTQTVKGPKVFHWPRDEVLVGYVGAATLGDKTVPAWLMDRRDVYKGIISLEEIAKKLKDEIETQRTTDERSRAPEPLIFHVGGFEEKQSLWAPSIWIISNIYKLGHYGYLDVRKQFQANEEFWKNFPITDRSEIRAVLRVMAKQFQPFWFHQAIDLATFNVLESSIRTSFKLLCEQHPAHDIPQTLADWSCHTRMQILMYGAYYEAFYPPGKRYVGGGAEVLTLPWP